MFFSLPLLAACGSQPLPTSVVEATLPATPTTQVEEEDPCSPQTLPTTVREIDHLMQEFDYASQRVADQTAQELPPVISNLQRIRRDAEDLEIPPCLSTLKTHQLNHMNLTLRALLGFVAGGDPQSLDDGLNVARNERDRYALELARLLSSTSTIDETPLPSSTP